MVDFQVLSELEQRIIIALQVDGRATWRKIAKVLDEPERTVARHGAALLEESKMNIAAIRHRAGAVIAALNCVPGTVPVASEALSARTDTSFTYMVTGQSDVVSELHYDGGLDEILTLQLPATPGLSQIQVYPILKFFKTIRGWRAGNLTLAQLRMLEPEFGGERTEWHPTEALDATDLTIIDVLRRDGRASVEAISRQVKLGESSVSRRVEALLRGDHISIRTLVEPALLGLPVEALLWVQVSPERIDDLGQRLSKLPQVRYLAAIAGDAQLLVDVTVPSQQDLYRFIAQTDWGQMVQLRTSLVLSARKRGGRLVSTVGGR